MSVLANERRLPTSVGGGGQGRGPDTVLGYVNITQSFPRLLRLPSGV